MEKRNVYKGHRYVPKIMGEWDQVETYEGLSIVTYQGGSYTSRKRVPVGIDILDEEYWVGTGNYNAQVENYRQEVKEFDSRISETESGVENNFTQLAQHQILLTDMTAHASEFGLIGGVNNDDTENLRRLFNSDYSSILFPKEKIFRVTSSINVTDGVEKTVDLNGSTILVDFDIARNFLRLYKNVKLINGTIDFNGKNVGRCLYYEPNLGTITVRNMVFRNLYDTTTGGTAIMSIDGGGNSLDIQDITLENLIKVRYEGGTPGADWFNGIYTYHEAVNGGEIRNMTVKNFNRVDVNGNVELVTSNPIYLGSHADSIEVNLTIDGLYAYNFGRRLLKSQVSNLTIKNVYAESYDGGSMVCLGLLDRDATRTSNINVSDVTIKGRMQFGIFYGADDVNLSNINVDIEPNEDFSNVSAGIGIAGDNGRMTNITTRSKHGVYGTRSKLYSKGAVKNTTLMNATMQPISHNSYPIYFANTNYEPFDGFHIQNLVVEQSDDHTQPAIYVGNFDFKSSNLTIDNYTIMENHELKRQGNGGILRNIDNVSIRNVNHLSRKGGGTYRTFELMECSNIQISNVYAPYNDSIMLFIDEGIGGYIKEISEVNTSIYLKNSSVKVGPIDRDFITIEGDFIGENFVKNYTSGPTSERPEAYGGDMYFDTTLGKIVFRYGGDWVDANGDVV